MGDCESRLGPLGFLSLGNETIFGNQVDGSALTLISSGHAVHTSPATSTSQSISQGMWDLKLALHFIQENIGQLGGDPDKVI